MEKEKEERKEEIVDDPITFFFLGKMTPLMLKSIS